MKFIYFADRRFQECQMKCNKAEAKEQIDAWADAETKSIYMLLQGYRTLLKWLLVPKVFVMYLLVNLHLIDAPKAVITDLIKDQRRREAESKALAEKIKADMEQKKSGETLPVVGSDDLSSKGNA